MEALEVVALVMTNKSQLEEQGIRHPQARHKAIMVVQIQHNQAHIHLLEEVALLLLALMAQVRNQVRVVRELRQVFLAHQ
jgi:hypothetical protein